MSSTRTARPTVIFSGAVWHQRSNWQEIIGVLSPNACLLAVDPKNKKLSGIMHQIARAFANKGRTVHFWLKPTAIADKALNETSCGK